MAKKQQARNKPVTQTFQTIKQNVKIFLGVGLVAVVVDLLLWLGGQGESTTGQSFWMAIVFTAFLWTTGKLINYKNPKLSVRKVFYEGSSAFVKMFLVIMFWVACLIPFLVGSLIFAQVNSSIVTATTLEIYAALAGWLLLTALSLYLVLRSIFAAVLILNDTPWRAITASRHMTKQRVLWLSLRLLGWLVITSAPAIFIFSVSARFASSISTQSIHDGLLQGIASALTYLFVLPVISVLLYQLYVHEKSSRPRR